MEILATVIGGFLAAGTGWFVQSRIEKARMDRLKTLFIVVLKDDLSNSITLYDQLSDDWTKSQIVWFTTINEFSDSRDIYVRNKDWIALIADQNLRQKILLYYRRSANHLLQLQNAQQRKYDIQRHYNALVREFQLHQGVAEDDAKKEAKNSMANEAVELDSIERQLPTLIQQLGRFKIDAQSILDSLEKP